MWRWNTTPFLTFCVLSVSSEDQVGVCWKQDVIALRLSQDLGHVVCKCVCQPLTSSEHDVREKKTEMSYVYKKTYD